MTTKTYAIETINRADGSVDGHAAGCRDIARIASREHADRSGAWEATSKRAVFLDYNQDFIDEADGDETAGYEINWLPCANHVPATDGEESTTTTTEKESTMSTETTTTATPNVRTYDTGSKALVKKALEVDCTIPYCRAQPSDDCVSAKGKNVEPHTRRVQKALAVERAAAKAAAKAKAEPKASTKKASKKAEPVVEETPEPVVDETPELHAVCKPCLTRHHKSCKGTDEAPCGCESKVHAA